MADYPDIKGFNIQSKSSDPVPFAQAKVDSPWQGAWASGGALNTGRSGNAMASHGTIPAGLTFGGQPPDRNQTEKYDGSSWTETGDLNTARAYLMGGGTQTSAIGAGGQSTPPTTTQGIAEEFNGSAWTETGDLNTARFKLAGWGATAEAVIAVGGATSPGANEVANAETFNGSAWSETGDLNTARQLMGSFGASSTSGIVAGGNPSPPSDTGATESWNGTSWTEVSDLNTTRTQMAGFGTATDDGYVAGGYDYGPNAGSTTTENWDGTAWTEVGDLASAKWEMPGSGSATSGLIAGGDPGAVTTSEEWTFSGIPPATTAVGYADAIVGDMYYNTTDGLFKAIKEGGAPLGTWASGASLNTGRMEFPGAGATKEAGIAITGYKESDQTLYTNVEEYNGTSWSEKADVSTARKGAGAFGSSTSAFCIDGALNPPGASQDLVESWNGTAWSETTENNTARCMIQGMCVSSSVPTGMMIGGGTPPGYGTTEVAVTETWDGSSWTETGDLNTARALGGAGGSSANAVLGGGYAAPGTTNATETFNGSTWTEAAEINTSRNAMMGNKGGSSTLGLIFGGGPGPGTVTESWNGTAWTEQADLADAATGAGFGSPASTMNAGGSPPTSTVTTTEEWAASDFLIKAVTTT
jgi:hypothetical protein